MNYNQFVQAVESKVKEAVKKNAVVSIHAAEKNNGVCRKGLMIAQKGINISPTIYLEEYYEQFGRGMSLENIVSEVLHLYEEVRFKKPWKNEKLQTYEDVEEKITYRLVNRRANRELLESVPYIPYLDLAIVFYVLLEATDNGTVTMLVRREHMEQWKVSKEELYRKARENTPRLLPYEFQTMRAVLEDLTGGCPVEERDILFVLTNRVRSFGAAVILYPGRLEQIGRLLEENFYVLPSSIHEVILLPESDAPDRDYLEDMVTEINATQVEAEEVLSDNVYYYDRESRTLSC